MTCVVEIDIQKRRHIIVLLGSGLIGGAISRELQIRFNTTLSPLNILWNQDANRSFQNIYRMLMKLVNQSGNKLDIPHSVHIIWAAGLAGFSSETDETKKEFNTFAEFIDLTSTFAANDLGARIHFHLISSVGGLFEGQRLISTSSTPNPIRPYGELKLAQEKLLSKYRKNITCYIYRLTTVYGFIRPRQRRGLISALIENARCGRITIISGSMYTLRDFVWAPDVSRFVVRTVVLGKPLNGPVVLASGKPETVENVKRYVEFSLNRKVYSRYLYTPTNDAHTCILPTTLPDGWIPSYMKSNIDRILSNYRSFDTQKF